MHGVHAALRFPRRRPALRILMKRRESRHPQPMAHGNENTPSHPAVRLSRPSHSTNSRRRQCSTSRPSSRRPLIAVAAASSFASPAVAGQCATPGTNDLANAPTMPKGVTDDVIGAIDLGTGNRCRRPPAAHASPGRPAGRHRPVAQPQGPSGADLHVSGSITEYSSSLRRADRAQGRRDQPRGRRPQPLLDNHGKEPAVLLSSDVFHGQ